MQQEVKAKPFHFRQFTIEQDQCSMKIGTDGVLLGAWADVDKAETILDIGTGSGVIAIMLAQRTTTAKIYGIEIDEDAGQQASKNMKSTTWQDRLFAINTSIQEFAKNSHHTFDLIVSNPPFFTGGTFSSSQDKNSVRHTIKLPHGDLLHAVRSLLSDKGSFSTILPYIEGLRFKEMAATYGLYCHKITQVIPVRDKPVERLLLSFGREVKPVERTELVLKDSPTEDWTSEYKELTSDFYLNM